MSGAHSVAARTGVPHRRGAFKFYAPAIADLAEQTTGGAE